MLSNFRKFAQSPAAVVLLGLLILSFAVWGVSGIFTGSGTAVVIVDDEQVSLAELQSSYEQELRRIQAQDPSFTREQAQQIGIGDQVLQRLISRAAHIAKADDLALSVSGTALVNEVSTYPAFQNPATGRYDYDTMQMTLRSSQMTQFQQQLEGDLLIGQLRQLFENGVATPRLLAETRYRVMEEQRVIRALFLDAQQADAIEDPTDEQLQELIDNNPDMADTTGRPIFTAPEYRSVTLVRFQVADFADDVEIDEETLRANYDYAVQSGQLGTPATRSFSQVTVADQAQGDAITARVQAGESLAAIATETGLETPFEQDAVQAYQIPDTQLGDAVFAAANGTVMTVEGSFGWYVVQVTDAAEAYMPTFEDQLIQLRQDAARAQATNDLFDKLAEFETARAEGLTLEEAAGQAGMPVEIYAPLDRLAQDQSGELDFQRYQSLAADIMRIAFDQVLGFETDIQQYNETDYFALRVDAIEESRQKSLDEVRELADRAWRDMQLDTQLLARIEDALAQLEAGDDLDMVSITTGARVESATLRRTDTAGPFTAGIVGQAFTQDVGEYQIAQSPGQGQQAIIIVDDVVPADINNAELGEIGTIYNTISDDMTSDLMIELQSALYREYDIANATIDARLRALALGESSDALQ